MGTVIVVSAQSRLDQTSVGTVTVVSDQTRRGWVQLPWFQTRLHYTRPHVGGYSYSGFRPDQPRVDEVTVVYDQTRPE